MLVPPNHGKLIAHEQRGQYGDDGQVTVYAPEQHEPDDFDMIFVPKDKREDYKAKLAEKLKKDGPNLIVEIRTERYCGQPSPAMSYSVAHLRMLYKALGKALEKYPEEEVK